MTQREEKPTVMLPSVGEVLSKLFWFLGLAKIEDEEETDPELTSWLEQQKFGKTSADSAPRSNEENDWFG